MSASPFNFGGGNKETGGGFNFNFATSGGGAPKSAGNQFFPILPSFPSQGGGNPSGNNISPYGGGFGQNAGMPQQSSPVPTGPLAGMTFPNIPGTYAVPPQYTGLSGQFANWLTSQIGQGVSPFNQSTLLPSGGQTQPGQLSAPMMGSLNTIAQNGIDALPQWQAMIAAMQQPLQQQQANIQEQFASMGDLAGSPFGTAMSNFAQGTVANEQSLLGQLTQQNILQGQIPAAEFVQGQDQQAVQNQYGEFVRTSPQYNPLINDMLSMGSLYPPTVSPGSGMGGLGALLSGSGAAASGIASLLALMP